LFFPFVYTDESRYLEFAQKNYVHAINLLCHSNASLCAGYD